MTILANIITQNTSTFLLAYVGILFILGGGSLLVTKMADKTSMDAVPDIPDAPDPHQVAYLRGGSKEVLRLMIFDLSWRGYLQVTREQAVFDESYWLHAVEDGPNPSYLESIEKLILERVSHEGILLSAVLQDDVLLTRVENQCAGHDQHLADESLLLPQNARTSLQTIRLVCLLIIVVICIYRLLLTTDMMFFVGVTTLMACAAIVFLVRPKHRTNRGNRLLELYTRTFSRMRENAKHHPELHVSQGLLLAAIYGPEAMAHEDTMVDPID